MGLYLTGEALQKYLDRLDHLAMIIWMKCNKLKCQIVLLGQSNAKQSPAERNLGFLVGSRLNMNASVPWKPREQSVTWSASNVVVLISG